MGMDTNKIEQQDDEEEAMCRLKQRLLKLFDRDKDVQDKIISFSAAKEQNNAQLIKDKEAAIQRLSEENRRLKDEFNSLQKTLGEKQHRLAGIEEKNRIMEDDLGRVKNEAAALTGENKRISGELNEATALAEALKRKYEPIRELEDIYHAYNKLPRDLKDSMAGFIRGDSLLSFVISGARDSRIEKFWEFCRIEVQKSNGLEYSRELASIFSFFFTKINASAEPSLYELIIPPKGTKFDEDSMIPSNNSPSKNGAVDSLVLPGYIGMNTGKVIKKAVVLLKG